MRQPPKVGHDVNTCEKMVPWYNIYEKQLTVNTKLRQNNNENVRLKCIFIKFKCSSKQIKNIFQKYFPEIYFVDF